MKTNLIGILLSFIVLFASKEANSKEIYAQKGVFLSNGVIYSYNFSNKTKSILINTTDSIWKFIVSPDHRYIAYEKYFKHIKSAGIYENEEDRPFVPINSIVVWDLNLMKKIKEIEPEKNGLFHINIEKWIDNDVLLFGDCGHFDFSGYFTYTINDSIRNLGYPKNARILESTEFSQDNSKKIFIDNQNYLHVVDLKESRDTAIFLSNKEVRFIELSPNNKYIAWYEIECVIEKVNMTINTTDKAYIKSLVSDSVVDIHNIPFSRETGIGRGDMSINFNGTFIAIGANNKLYIYDIVAGEKYVILGYHLSWLDNKSFIYNKENNLFLYNTNTNESTLFCENAYNFEPIKYAR